MVKLTRNQWQNEETRDSRGAKRNWQNIFVSPLFVSKLNCHWLSDENFFSLKPKPFVTDVTPFPVLYIVTLVRYYIWFPVQYIFYNTVIAQKDLSESVTELFIVFRRFRWRSLEKFEHRIFQRLPKVCSPKMLERPKFRTVPILVKRGKNSFFQRQSFCWSLLITVIPV